MKASAQPIDVNTEELKLLVERAREAPLEEAGCRKLHALIDTFEYVTLLLEDKQTTIQALRPALVETQHGEDGEDLAEDRRRSQRETQQTARYEDAQEGQGARPQQCRVI